MDSKLLDTFATIGASLTAALLEQLLALPTSGGRSFRYFSQLSPLLTGPSSLECVCCTSSASSKYQLTRKEENSRAKSHNTGFTFLAHGFSSTPKQLHLSNQIGRGASILEATMSSLGWSSLAGQQVCRAPIPRSLRMGDASGMLWVLWMHCRFLSSRTAVKIHPDLAISCWRSWINHWNTLQN